MFLEDQEICEVTSCAKKPKDSYVGLGYLKRNSRSHDIKIGLKRVSAKAIKA